MRMICFSLPGIATIYSGSAAASQVLQLGETWTIAWLYVAAREFDSCHRGIATREREQGSADRHHVCLLRAYPRLDCRRDRTDDSVRQQNSEERSDQCGGHLLADLRRGAANRSHRDHHAKHGGHDSETRHRVTDPVQRAGHEHRFLMLALEIEIQDLREMMVFHCARQKHLQRVREERDCMMILRDRWILVEDVGVLRIFDMGFKADEAFLARLLEYVVQQLQQLTIRLFRVGARLEKPEHRPEYALDERRRVADDHRAERGASNNDEFRYLDQGSNLAMLHYEPAEDAAEYDYQTNDYEHAYLS